MSGAQSGLLSPALTETTPLALIACALQARVQQGFPAQYFDFAWIPRNADKGWFRQTMRRTAMVALGWNGCTSEGDGVAFAARSHWTLACVVKNPDVRARYFGDALTPGLFAMTRVATVLVNGYLVDPIDNPFCATETASVKAIGNLYNEDWGDENAALAALEISVLYEETPPPGLEQAPGSALSLVNFWNFGEQPPLFSDTVGGA